MDTKALGGGGGTTGWEELAVFRIPKAKSVPIHEVLSCEEGHVCHHPSSASTLCAVTIGQAVPSLEAHGTAPERSLPRMLLWNLIGPSDLLSSKLEIR